MCNSPNLALDERIHTLCIISHVGEPDLIVPFGNEFLIQRDGPLMRNQLDGLLSCNLSRPISHSITRPRDTSAVFAVSMLANARALFIMFRLLYQIPADVIFVVMPVSVPCPIGAQIRQGLPDNAGQ